MRRAVHSKRDDADELERILDAARRHGQESEPDHEVGDLLEVLRALWPRVPARTRRGFMRCDLVLDLLRNWGDEADGEMR
jgi:hypothetical protein